MPSAFPKGNRSQRARKASARGVGRARKASARGIIYEDNVIESRKMRQNGGVLQIPEQNLSLVKVQDSILRMVSVAVDPA